MKNKDKLKDVIKGLLDGKGQRPTARATGVPRSDVQRIEQRLFLLPEDWEKHDYNELYNILYPKATVDYGKEPIDYEQIHSELTKHPYLTLTELWKEYVALCKAKNTEPYMYSQYAAKYSEYAITSKATMPLHKKPGVCEVDWSGDLGHFKDPASFKEVPVHVFVGALPYSQMFYVEGFYDETKENWINAHINMFHFFGGVPHTIISDNLRTGVIKPDKYEAILQTNYQELGEYYNTVIIPARPAAPKDKGSGEGNVNMFQQKILAPMRNKELFSLQEWNDEARKLLMEILSTNFQKKDENRSRVDIFREEEVTFLNPLPAFDYEIFEEVKRKVAFNYHVTIEKQYFSVPYTYVKKEVLVRYNKRTVIIYFKGTEIAKHENIAWKKSSYTTLKEHMPANHQFVSQWTKEKLLSWADDIGPNTHSVCSRIFDQYQYEEQAYKTILGILNAGKKGNKAMEYACEVALALPGKLSMRIVMSFLPKEGEAIPKITGQLDLFPKKEAPKGFLRFMDYGEKENE